jgi:hypothetical protein
MTQRFRLTALFLALVLAASLTAACELDLDIPLPPHDSRLVVNALFATDTTLTVHLGRSLGVGHRGNPRIVENGRVALYMDGQFVEMLRPTVFYEQQDGPIHFLSEHVMQPGRTYRIHAEADGLQPVTAEERTPPLPSYEIVSITRGPTDPSGLREDRVVLRIQDPPGRSYYYLWFPSYYEHPMSDGPPQIIPQAFRSDDPVLQDGQLFDLFDIGGQRYMYAAMFSDAAFDGQAYTLTVDVRTSDRHGSDTPYLRLDAVSEQYYRYVRARQAISDNYGNPFAEPIALPSNVDGGLGIFAGRSGRDVLLQP